MPARKQKSVAYLCSEFAIDSDLPTYSGGLGILAGDLVSEAADENFPLTGIGILYKGREFIQHINSDGTEEKRDSQFDHDASFLRQTQYNGENIILEIETPNASRVKVKTYQLRLAEKTNLYFLSSDIDGNPNEWIYDMSKLYGGDTDSQIRQQIILGIGGIRLLKRLGKMPDIFHINEGRPCFIIWELTKILMEEEHISFEDAWAKAKEKVVYTNHTLVLAGNLSYPKEAVLYWASPFAQSLGVTSEQLIADGIVDNYFNITKFALNNSSKHSAVSKAHEKYSKEVWPDYTWTSITNGVYMPRWQDSDFRNTGLTDRQIWDEHLLKKRELQDTVLKRTGIGYDPERLVISWARRLAEYKQPHIIFQDIQKLKQIVNDSDRPIQLLFAGNSHAADHNAKNLIDGIIKLFSGELHGHAIFVPNYNIALANNLVSGSDIWLNTPMGNLEACGTSGMKALSNGVLNCTVLDGWTHEVNWEGVGWTLDPKNVAQEFYRLIETEIAPLYHKRNEEGLPAEWIQRMKKSIEIAKKFSTNRMLQDYKEKLYS